MKINLGLYKGNGIEVGFKIAEVGPILYIVEARGGVTEYIDDSDVFYYDKEFSNDADKHWWTYWDYLRDGRGY